MLINFQYSVLYEKEKEIEEFLENYEEERSRLRKSLEERETRISLLLEKTTKNLEIERKGLDRHEFEELGKELNFKQNQTQNAERTLARVRQELLRRREDCRKIQQFERVFPQKMANLKEQLEKMREEIRMFDNKEQERQQITQSIGQSIIELLLYYDMLLCQNRYIVSIRSMTNIRSRRKIRSIGSRIRMTQLGSLNKYNLY